MTTLNVVDLGSAPLHDVPARLRDLANDIEAGGYGKVQTCAVVLFAEKLSVFGFGPESDAPFTHIVLSAGAHRLARPLVNFGG